MDGIFLLPAPHNNTERYLRDLLDDDNGDEVDEPPADESGCGGDETHTT